MKVALVSRELDPFGGAGIGQYVSACARLLSREADVTVFTTSSHKARYEELRAAGDPRVLPSHIDMEFVPDVGEGEAGEYYCDLHLYSARVLDALREYYGGHGPDLIEFSDYLGEGAVTVQARRSAEAFLRSSVIGIRLHTSAEVCAVLNGHRDSDFGSRMLWELERLAIRDADYLLWAGGDTLGLYRRFYGSSQVAPDWRIRHPVTGLDDYGRNRSLGSDGMLRLLYLGRLERRKGVQGLIRAMAYVGSDRVRLDLVGGDTMTAPLGGSMDAQLRLMAAGDPRISILGPVPRAEVPAVVRASDIMVLPSLWEAWPYVGLEALGFNRPVLATSVGGFTEMVRPGRSGWLLPDHSPGSLADTIEQLVFQREQIEQMFISDQPASVFSELTDPVQILEGYREMLARGGRWNATGASAGRQSNRQFERQDSRTAIAPKSSPLVSVIIPYYRLHEHIEETVRSALEQTYGRVEVILINDGSAVDSDWVLMELATRYPITVLTQLNSGLGAARNFGVSQSRGRYLVPLDADDLLEPLYVERTLRALENNPNAAYVTTWSLYTDESGEPLGEADVGYQPIGNVSSEVVKNNIAGSAVALFPRTLFDEGFSYSQSLTSYEDWEFYQQLHLDGRYGLVIPERLFRYRVRATSMTREVGSRQLNRLAGELDAYRDERTVKWHLSA
jgi:glycogen(starch) synthase